MYENILRLRNNVEKYFDFFIFYFHKLNKPESLNELKVARAYKEREKHVVGRDPFTFATIIKDDIFQSSQFYKLGPVLYVASSTQIPPIPFVKLSVIPNRLLKANLTSPTSSICQVLTHGALLRIRTWFLSPQKRIIIHPQNIPAPLLSFSPHFPYIFFALSSYGGFSLFNFLLLTIFLWQNEFYMEHAQKLQEVRSVLKEVGEDTLEALLMIDAIQRLGIDYHFHGEIEVVLQRLHTKFNTVSDCHNNLYELALGFRLLRQEGYYVSAGGIFFFFFLFFFHFFLLGFPLLFIYFFKYSKFRLLNHLF